MRISVWSSDVCSSDLRAPCGPGTATLPFRTPAPQAQTENESTDDRLAFDERRTPCFRRIASARKQESRTEERSVGKGGGRTGRTRWSRNHKKRKLPTETN